MHNFFYKLSLFTFTVMVATMIWGLYLYVKPHQELKVNVKPIKIVEHAVQRGKSVSYIVDYCRYDDSPIMVYHILVNDKYQAIVPIMTLRTFGEKGCKKVQVFVPIPSTLRIGKWRIETIAETRVNIFRTEVGKYTTEEFVVE